MKKSSANLFGLGLKRAVFCLVALLLISFSILFDMFSRSEVLILLPGQIRGERLVLAETSSFDITINGNLVPTYINAIWWCDNLIITENYLPDSRGRIDHFNKLWYVLDLSIDDVFRFTNYSDLEMYVIKKRIDPDDIQFMSLGRARKIREKELGFRFTTFSVYEYIKGKRN